MSMFFKLSTKWSFIYYKIYIFNITGQDFKYQSILRIILYAGCDWKVFHLFTYFSQIFILLIAKKRESDSTFASSPYSNTALCNICYILVLSGELDQNMSH